MHKVVQWPLLRARFLNKNMSMTPPYRCALIGFGTIASAVHGILSQEPSGSPDLHWGALVRPSSARARPPAAITVFDTPEALLAWKPDLVIEAAGQTAVRTLAPAILEAGVNMIITSAGALADPDLYQRLDQAARQGKSRIIIPSGAVGTLDYLNALQGTQNVHVVYESRKPVAAWRQELITLGHDPDALTGPLQLFEGYASEAALRYPQNLNVAATLALAGMGMQATRVRVVADPGLAENQHRIQVNSPIGTLDALFQNTPAANNPKTSAIVAHSVAQAVRRQFSHFTIG